MRVLSWWFNIYRWKKCVKNCQKYTDGACKCSNEVCINFAPNVSDECEPCPDESIYKDGKKFVKCKVDKSEGVCKKTILKIYTNFEPDESSSNECKAWIDCKTSEDGMKCINKSLSSSVGLSGGTIVGIVVGSVVIVDVIGLDLLFVSKGVALTGTVNTLTAAYSQTATSSLSNINVPKKH